MLRMEDVLFRDAKRKTTRIRYLQSVGEHSNDNIVGYCVALMGDGINEELSEEFGIIVTNLFPEQPVGELLQLN